MPKNKEYAQVTRMMGNGRLEALCFDGVKRMCHIRGKLRKKVWINTGDIILLGLREFQDMKADVIQKYTPDEARNLKAYGELPETAKLSDNLFDEDHNEEIEFHNNYDDDADYNDAMWEPQKSDRLKDVKDTRAAGEEIPDARKYLKGHLEHQESARIEKLGKRLGDSQCKIDGDVQNNVDVEDCVFMLENGNTGRKDDHDTRRKFGEKCVPEEARHQMVYREPPLVTDISHRKLGERLDDHQSEIDCKIQCSGVLKDDEGVFVDASCNAFVTPGRSQDRCQIQTSNR